MVSLSRHGRSERVVGNLEHLVQATLDWGRGHSSVAGGGRGVGGLGLAAVMPASLGRTTNIEHILQAADDVEDPNVLRIRKPVRPLSFVPPSLRSPLEWVPESLILGGSDFGFVIDSVCEQAYTMAQNLDPSSERRGILQFKTSLQSVIKVCLHCSHHWFLHFFSKINIGGGI
ncbi:unnamed protein product [Urochloa humidicola]